MKNVYSVKLVRPVSMNASPHFGGKETGWVYVVASSFENACDAVRRKYPAAEIKGIDLLNYTGVPIVIGD